MDTLNSIFEIEYLTRRVNRMFGGKSPRGGRTALMDKVDAEIIQAEMSDEYNIVNGITHYSVNVHILFPSLQGQPDDEWPVKKPFSEFVELRDHIYEYADPNRNIPRPKSAFPSKNMNNHSWHFTEDNKKLINDRQKQLGAWLNEIINTITTDDGLAAQEKQKAKNLILHFLDTKLHLETLRKEERNDRLAEVRARKEERANKAQGVPVAEATAVAATVPTAPDLNDEKKAQREARRQKFLEGKEKLKQ